MADDRYDDSWRSAPIDHKVRKLVECLNTVPNVRTESSCSGHLFKNSSPYVAFEASVEFARALEMRLRADAHLPTPELKAHSWVITGHFGQNGNLLFRLSLGPAEFSTFNTFKKWSVINNDYNVISNYVEEIKKSIDLLNV